MNDSAADDDREPSGRPRRAEQDETENTPPAEESRRAKLPSRLTFRITPVAVLVILALAVCISPVAAAVPWLSLLYSVPLGLLVWVLRVRTVVDGDGVTAKNITGTRRVAWSELSSLRLDERRWVRAVKRNGETVLLPTVRVRDLPRLSAMSGGRLADPTETKDTGQPDDTDIEDRGQNRPESESGSNESQ